MVLMDLAESLAHPRKEVEALQDHIRESGSKAYQALDVLVAIARDSATRCGAGDGSCIAAGARDAA